MRHEPRFPAWGAAERLGGSGLEVVEPQVAEEADEAGAGAVVADRERAVVVGVDGHHPTVGEAAVEVDFKGLVGFGVAQDGLVPLIGGIGERGRPDEVVVGQQADVAIAADVEARPAPQVAADEDGPGLGVVGDHEFRGDEKAGKIEVGIICNTDV